MFDQSSQSRRIQSEITEREALRTAEAWLADQDARLAMTKPRPTDPRADEWARGARDAVLFMAVAFVVIFGLLSIGGM